MTETLYGIIQPEKEEDSGLWKPDPERGECGQDLNLRFIVCDDPDECLATRNEFPYMVCSWPFID